MSSGLLSLARPRTVFATFVIPSGLVATEPRAAAQLIDTATPWLADGASSWASPFGEPSWAAWSQTFVTPTGYPKLKSFSVWVQSTKQYGEGFVDAVDFDGRVYEWDNPGRKLVGPALCLSAPKHIPHEDNGETGDMVFRARFSALTPVPEPSAYGAIAAALLTGLVLVRRRTRDTARPDFGCRVPGVELFGCKGDGRPGSGAGLTAPRRCRQSPTTKSRNST